MNVSLPAGPGQTLLQAPEAVRPADEVQQDRFNFQNKIKDSDGEYQQEMTREVSKLGASVAPIVPDAGVQVAAMAQDSSEKEEATATPRHAVQAYGNAAGDTGSRESDFSGTI